jgi:hypothetical protein
MKGAGVLVLDTALPYLYYCAAGDSSRKSMLATRQDAEADAAIARALVC